MNKIKVAFFGTSDRSVAILNTLRDNFDLRLCITKNDVLVGRHQERKPVSVKVWAKNNGVEYMPVSTLRGKEVDDILEKFKLSEIEYAVIADFSFIIPPQFIEHYGKKLINIHFSLLPKHRGASPVQFAILNGDEMAGITYHLVANKMDSGDIIHQIGYKMSQNETSGFLYNTLFELAARELPQVIINYDKGTLIPRKQGESSATYTLSKSHPKSTFIYKEDAEINWKDSPENIYRMIRAFNPWPVAWSSIGSLENNKKIGNGKIKLRATVDRDLKVKIIELELSDDGNIILKKVQVEGKNALQWDDFANGYVI